MCLSETIGKDDLFLFLTVVVNLIRIEETRNVALIGEGWRHFNGGRLLIVCTNVTFRNKRAT